MFNKLLKKNHVLATKTERQVAKLSAFCNKWQSMWWWNELRGAAFHLIEQKWEHFITKRLDKTFWEPCFKIAVMWCFFLRLHKLLDKLLCQGFVYTNGLTSVLLNLHLRKNLFAQSAKNVNIAETTVTYLVIYSIKE